MNTVDTDVRFRTFNVVNDSGKSYGKVIAVTAPTNEDKKEFNAQFAFCSPKDKFDKERGKFVAIKRLESFRAINFKYDGTRRISDILKDLIVSEASRKNLQWLKGVNKENIR